MTVVLSLVLYFYVSETLICLFSSAVAHYLITSFCILVAGPSIKRKLNQTTAKRIRFGSMNIPDCTSLGPPQMTLKELCQEVSVRSSVEWEIEKNSSRSQALILISVITYLIELLFCGISRGMLFFRSTTVSYGIIVCLFGFVQLTELHN